MTAAQRSRRLRQIDARCDALRAELRDLEAAARALENEQSAAMGYRMPLRGKTMIAAMDRAVAQVSLEPRTLSSGTRQRWAM